MFGTGSRACSRYPRAQAGWASPACWHRTSQVDLDPAKPSFFCRQQTLVEDLKKTEGPNNREMAWGSWIISLPSQQANLAGDNGVFALSVNSQLQEKLGSRSLCSVRGTLQRAQQDRRYGQVTQLRSPAAKIFRAILQQTRNLSLPPSLPHKRINQLIFQSCNPKHWEKRALQQREGRRKKGIVLSEHSLWEKCPFPSRNPPIPGQEELA